MTRRGSRSKIAKHPNLAEIELALANDIQLKKIGEKYGLTPTALCRYRQSMTPERRVLLKYRRGESPIDLERLKQGEAESTVQRNVVMMSELWGLFKLAADAGDHPTAIRAAREYREYNELQARLVGELISADQHVHLTIAQSPEYRRLVSFLMAWASNKPDFLADLAAFREEKERAAEATLEAKPNGVGTFETGHHAITS